MNLALPSTQRYQYMDQSFSSHLCDMIITALQTICRKAIITLLALSSICSGSVLAQQEDHYAVSGVDLSSPYHSMLTHLHYLQPENLDPNSAAQVIPAEIDSVSRVRMAIKIKKIYDSKGLFVYLNRVPENPDYRDSLSQRAVYTPFPQELPGLYLQRQAGLWQYSRESLRGLEDIYRAAFPYGTHLLVDQLDVKHGERFLGLYLWQYLGLILLIVMAGLLYLILDWIVKRVMRAILSKYFDLSTDAERYLRKSVHAFSLFICLFLISVVLPVLQLPVGISKLGLLVLGILMKILWVVIFLYAISLVSLYLSAVAQKTDNRLDDQFIPLLTKVLRIIVVLVGIMSILHSLDINITALIAGVSIGGLALALAAQDTVKNLIGSIMIFVDKPFQVGDYITASGFAGTVREVGFRTTRIETSDTSIIAVPNGTIVNTEVTNLGVRTKRLFLLHLAVQRSASSDQLESFMSDLRTGISEVRSVIADTLIVRLTSIEQSALHVMIRAHLDTTDYYVELEDKEKINMTVLATAEKNGVILAYPTQTIHLQNP